jgi:DNA replication and repair protein RecF
MISDIRLQQFRSYMDETFECSPSVNIIVGPNASGKTNLLEAILVVARGSSYRARDQELVAFEKPWARLDAHVGNDLRTVKIVSEPQPAKTYEFDGKVYKRLTQQHTLPVVLFEPNHLTLLSGSPDQRRNYLDDLLEQTIPNHAAMRRNYRRVLAQRNALLKRARKPSNEELFPWNLRLSELGALLARRRAELAATIDSLVGDHYRALAKATTKTRLEYGAQFPLESYESRLLEKLESSLAVDVMRGFTSAGPHREDFTVLFDGHIAEETASRGETRTFVLALKIIELEILKQARDMPPLLLLDDVFSELDGARRHALTDQLKLYQTFITTTDADIVLKNFMAKAQIIPITG